MSDDPQADLIYAILAMDSHNRGYGFGITGLADIGSNAKIGNYSIVQGISRDGWFNAGFYAIAYRNAATGETVISYRGTDVKGLFDSATMGGSDPLNGYGMALGATQAPQSQIQGRNSTSPFTPHLRSLEIQGNRI